ncbi:MAG: ComF family protein [Candidatus Krumholzibacteriota bacterium]|nr:ComF family protein [Candidatus Krumholzibacteriota bacterium]
MRERLAALWPLLLPSRCHACGRILTRPPRRWPRWDTLCEACARRLRRDGQPRRVPGGPPLLAAFTAEPALLALVKGWKYAGRDGPVPDLTDALARTLARAPWPRPWHLLPVPMPPWRRLARGFNQSEVLARGVARRLDLAPPTDCLRRRLLAGRQAGRGRAERLVRARQEFAARAAPPAEGSLVLVDDLCTTGATLRACAEALPADARPRVRALVLARVPRAVLDSPKGA